MKKSESERTVSVDALIERAQRAERRAAALVEVGALFATQRPLAEMLGDLAVKNVRMMADISLVHMLDESGQGGLVTTAVAAREPALEEAIRAHIREHPIRFDENVAGRVVFETGEGILLPDVTADDLRRLTRPVDAPLMEMLGLRSVMVLPLRGREGVIGTMDVVSLDPTRRYDRDDFYFVQEIANRAAAAVENMRLFQRLEAERALLRHVIEQMPEGVVITDRDGRLLLANQVAQAVEGFSQALGGPLVRAERVVRRRADGAEVPILVNSAPVRNERGEVESVVGVFQDVSEQKRLEGQLRELAGVAAERARRLETVIAQIADGVLVLDADGKVVIANDAAAKLFGTAREALLRPIIELADRFSVRAPAEHEDRPVLVAIRALGGETTVGAERTIVDAAGIERHLRLSAAPLRDEAGEVAGAVIVLGDITLMKELERARDEFLSVASHELKTPLTPLLALTELLLRGADRGDRADPAQARRLLRQVHRLKALIEDLLDVARAREGRLEIERQPFALRTMVERVVDEYAASVTTHEIGYLPPAGPVTVSGDERRLEEVLVNLLENATKYSPSGSRISVELRQLGSLAEVSVRDRGMGIPAADLPFLFERFQRARNVAAEGRGGFGLGLYIAREIVRLHEGTISLESVENQGTCVRFTLPTIG